VRIARDDRLRHLLHDNKSRNLTRREKDVLDALLDGLGNTAIAVRLGVSIKTVKNHLARIYDKLGAHTRAEVIVRVLSRPGSAAARN
jgi:DNA-binding NarL/FixJ family response regulator